MGRSCERVGCERVAVTSALVNRVSLRFVLVDDLEVGTRLCSHHADRLTAPVGWEIVDERAPTPDDAASASPSTPLLARAFHGPETRSESRPPRRLAWFERADPSSSPPGGPPLSALPAGAGAHPLLG